MILTPLPHIEDSSHAPGCLSIRCLSFLTVTAIILNGHLIHFKHYQYVTYSIKHNLSSTTI